MPEQQKQMKLLEKLEDKDFTAAEQILASIPGGVNEPIHSQNKQPLINVVTMKKDMAALDWLISKGADLGQQDRDGRSPICHAVYHDDVELAKKLIAAAKQKGQGVNVNCENGDKVNAISHAVGHRQLEMVKLLLEHGADPNKRDRFGGTALNIVQDHAEQPEMAPIAALLGVTPKPKKVDL